MIVVTGATGNVGRELVGALAAAGEKVTAVSRQPARQPEGVEHRQADLSEPAGLRGAFDGADALFLLVAGENPQAILDAAKAGGVRRFVEQTREEARAQMSRVMPAPVVEGTLAILGTPSAAEQQVSPDVERLLGRPARSFADWAARNLAAFR
ncbi:NAD(P)H-binding protein [Nonomuraea sp. NPDC049152]|uniref:SDR family oxidoreductase n=1 Tax=Nonomuraea sp. NPDC049152 TaxID=3154350 RepID=UPI0033E165A9